MEKKFYIPTSSLNYNNVVSSESISPAYCYSKRGFGLKRFVDIFDGPKSDRVILSDQLLGFTRPASDIEDHPMLIEVCLDDLELIPMGTGFYATPRTIFITPYTCRFIFFTEQDRLVTESLSDHSLDVKLSSLYIPRMCIEKPIGKYDFSAIQYDGAKIQPVDNISFDERSNRLKGLLFGYYIGAMLSTNEIEVEKLKILQAVLNEFSGIISSGEKFLSSSKENTLRELSTKWSHLTPLYVDLADAQIDVQKLSQILSKHGVRLPIGNLRLNTYLPYLISPHNQGESNPAIEWIENEIEKLCNSMRRNGKKLRPEDCEVVTDGSNVVNIQVQDHPELVRHWLNTLMLDYTCTPLGEYSKMELADRITDSAIEFLGEAWKESQERVFLNKLRRHIDGEAFDVKWDNGALCSVAAVVLRGEEWDALLNFMQRKGMSDYRLAFAMYGALTGYANMTRDFVDILFEDKVYGMQVYIEFYGQLFGKDLNIEAVAPNNDNLTSPYPPTDICGPEKDVNPVVDSIIQKITSSDKFDRKKHDRYIGEIRDRNIVDWDMVKELSGRSRDGWKSLIDDITKPSKKKNRMIQGSINFIPDNNNIFKYDRGAWLKIEDIIQDEGWVNSKGRSRKQLIIEDLQWFQGSDMSIGDNKKDIERFCDKFKTQPNRNGNQQGLYYTPQIRQAIKQRLLSLYCNND